MGVSRVSTACSSASDSRKNGIEKTLKLGSIAARPTAVRNAACTVSKPGRILVMMVASSRLPPPNTVAVTRPSVDVFHVLPMSSSALCHVVDWGASVARLMRTGAARSGTLAAIANAAISRRFGADMCGDLMGIISG